MSAPTSRKVIRRSVSVPSPPLTSSTPAPIKVMDVALTVINAKRRNFPDLPCLATRQRDHGVGGRVLTLTLALCRRLITYAPASSSRPPTSTTCARREACSKRAPQRRGYVSWATGTTTAPIWPEELAQGGLRLLTPTRSPRASGTPGRVGWCKSAAG